jgi:hypothetical protein
MEDYLLYLRRPPEIALDQEQLEFLLQKSDQIGPDRMKYHDRAMDILMRRHKPIMAISDTVRDATDRLGIIFFGPIPHLFAIHVQGTQQMMHALYQELGEGPNSLVEKIELHRGQDAQLGRDLED